MIEFSPSWKSHLPDANVGLLVIHNAPNVGDHPDLQRSKQDLEEELRARYAEMDRKTLRQEPVFYAYDAFYRKFRKTYHVQLQLESVVFKGKPIFSPSALVTCMFLAELKTGLLTAAHDVSSVEFPLTAEIAAGGENYRLMSGAEQELKAGDMYIKDQQGILSSVIYGPDQRTQITPSTRNAAYTTYGPPGIGTALIKEQLELLENYIQLFAPNAERELLKVI
jgi:DNA/RNA-binding domain of Phe-tRNA-synthetase-like protein